MGLSEMQYLRGCFEEISQGQGWVDLRQFCDLCNLLLTHGASSSAETAVDTSEPVDEAFDTHTLEFLFRLVDSGRQGRVTLRDWIRASAVFCYGRLVHKLPFVFRFAADDTPEGPTLSTETVQMLIDAVFTVVAAPPGHSWSIARSPAPPGRWPPSHYASGALSVEHNPDTLWASAQKLMGSSGHMTYATYLAWAEREPAFSEWVGWVGSRGLRAINVVQSAKERSQFVAEMEMLGFSPTQLATLPPSAAATSQWPPATHPSSTDGSSHRGDSMAGQSSATLLSFEIDFKALSLERRVGEGTFAEVYAGRWLEAPVAVKIFKDRSSAVAMYQVRKHQTQSQGADDGAVSDIAADGDQNRGALQESLRDPVGDTGVSTFDELIDSEPRSTGTSTLFLREVELLSNLRHPNVLLYMGACVKHTSPLCIVSELVTGGSLYDALHGGPNRRRLSFSPLVKLRFSLDVARGMLYLHSLSPMLLHRDLKTSNILVDTGETDGMFLPEGQPSTRVRAVLCDFGLSRLDAAGTHRSASGEPTALVGTLISMAPEVIQYERYTSKADVYSFGMILWELWTGQVPYKGLLPAQLMFEVAIKGARPNVGPSSGVPPTVAALIRQCWAADQAQRPPFLEIVRQLQKFARNEMGVTV